VAAVAKDTDTGMAADREASCSCGALCVHASGEPLRVSICHCLECQRRTGSAFGVQARFPKASVRIDGASTAYTRKGDSGGDITFHFCPTCGSTVWYELPTRFPDAIGIAVGAFADPSFATPRFSVYEARKHAWVALPDGIEHMQ
jgi:hypothetical protein